MQNKNLVFIIIGSLLLLAIGYVLGSVTKLAVPVEKPLSPLTKLMGSKVIRPITVTASGKIIEISNRTLTLGAEGDVWIIPIREDALIHRLLPPEEAKETPWAGATFEEMKIGDTVDIYADLKADGSLEGKQVLILP
jgi:hypothetical protein